jgi:pimeloyl-ACP methyl ester carboxylesterase
MIKASERKYFYGIKGERLLIQEWGEPTAPVLLMIHGFPGCADHATLMAAAPLVAGIRIIAMDRPGYGQSDVQRKMSPLKFAQQMKNFLDENNIEELSILSVSGGAPYSFALAYLLKDRVRKFTSVAGVAPLSAKNFRYMNSQQKKAFFLKKVVPEPVLEKLMKRIWSKGLAQLESFLFSDENAFSPQDRKVFAHPQVGPALLSTVKTSLSNGPGGVLQDIRVYSKPWGFPLHEVHCPVTLWHGGADDVVHHKYAEDMQRLLPKAQLKLMVSEGHYSLPMNWRDQILEDLLAPFSTAQAELAEELSYPLDETR